MKRTVIGVMLLVLLLPGCGKREAEEKSLLEKAAGMDGEQVILCINGTDIEAWRYLYWLARVCEQLQEQYDRAEIPLDWQAVAEDMGTVAQYAKEQALADTAIYAVVEQWADIYDCSSNGAERVQAEADPFLTQAQSAALEAVGQSYQDLYALYCTPGSLLAPTDKEVEMFAVDQGEILIDRIFVADQGDRALAKQQAEEWFARLNKAEDQAAMFTELAQAGADSHGPRALKEAAFGPALEAAAKTLDIGQISGILETEEGYSILRHVPEKMESLRAAYFDFLLQREVDRCEIQITEAYQKLDAGNFYEKLLRIK